MRPATDPKFGDYQANGCMALASAVGRKPRDLAQEIAQQVDLSPIAGAPEVAGPGFLNLRLNDAWIAATLQTLLAGRIAGSGAAGTSQVGRHRLLVTQRRQADARGAYSVDRDRR